MNVATLSSELLELGVRPGDVLVVHSAFSRVGPVVGGPGGLIDALARALGPEGTLVMPSFSDDDDSVFDPETSPCRSMGVVADTFWRLPGVARSDSPHAFAARGPAARRITADRPLEVPHGLQSPVGRVYELDGSVLLVGVGHDANTTLHLAENLAGVRYGLPSHATVLEGGRAVRREYLEADHCCARFALMDDWLGARQRRGSLGRAEVRLMRSRDVVETALARLRDDEAAFLHAPGECAECDESRAAIPASV